MKPLQNDHNSEGIIKMATIKNNKGFLKSHINKVADIFLEDFKHEESRYELRLHEFKCQEIYDMYPTKDEDKQERFRSAVVEEIEMRIFWDAVHSNISKWSAYQFSEFKLNKKVPS